MIPGKTNYIRFTPTRRAPTTASVPSSVASTTPKCCSASKVVSDAEFNAHMDQLRQDGNTGLLGEEYDRNPATTEAPK